MKLPLKTRILQYAIEHNGEFSVEDLMKELEPAYKDEPMFKRKQVEDYCDSYLGVGFFVPTKKEFDENGSLQVWCKVTDYGKARGQYIK